MRSVKYLLLLCLALLPSVCAAETTLLDFSSTWCGPCQTMTPVVDQLANEGFMVEKIDIVRQPELAREYGVNAIPCYVVVENGREVDRVNGVTTIERLKVKMQRRPAVKRKVKGEPTPAWRYEYATGYRRSVVRIYCQDDYRTRSIGSGVLVKWGGKIAVLTARHVVKDAKKIIVELVTKKAHYAHVLKVDAVWDCAVLELTSTPEGVEPAEVELGQAAVQSEGVRLESCGYGPDGKLAANNGLFIGYRRSTTTPSDGPDDWMLISGHARGGDSGGPVFNARGRVVGILWGTDGTNVVCVQPGRIHVTLDAAESSYRQRSLKLYGTDAVDWTDGKGNIYPSKPIQLTQCGPQGCDQTRQGSRIFQRNPTPPKDAPSYQDPSPAPEVVDEAAYGKQKPILNWREGAQGKDNELEQRQKELLQALDAERQARLAGQNQQQQPPTVIVNPPAVPAADARPADEALTPLGVILCLIGAGAAGIVLFYVAGKN